jgi:hypothetical protein
MNGLPSNSFRRISDEVYMNTLKSSDLPRTVEILCKSTPTDPMFGYGDPFKVYIGSELVGEYEGSACPNGFKVLSDEECCLFKPEQILRKVTIDGIVYDHIVMWDSTYGKIACGQLRGQIVRHTKYGKCILIKNGGAVPAIIPRRKYDWHFQMKEIFIHPSDKDKLSGDNIDWRGSAGCPTVRKFQYPDFISNFRDPWVPNTDKNSPIIMYGEWVTVVIREDNGR